MRKSGLGLAAALLLGALGCGSSSSNDQGTSFQAIGYFRPVAASTSGSSTTTSRQGQSGAISPLTADIGALPATLPSGVSLQGDGLAVITSIGLVNRLAREFIIVQSVECEHFVPGASISIPPSSFALGVVLAANPAFAPTIPGIPPQVQIPGVGTGTGTTGGSSSGTGGTNASGTAQISYSDFFVVAPEVFGYLNNNQSALPSLPFRLVSSCSAIGRTQSGETLRTNPINFTTQMVAVSECCTGGTVPADPGFADGAGTGGDLPTDGSATTTTVAN